MGRRTSNGVVGSAGAIGQLSITGNTLSTTQSNTNLIIDPQGTGITQFVGNLQANGNATTGGEVRLMDADSSNYVAFRSVANIASNRTLVFPDSVGNNGFVLTTDGSNPATLSWTSAGGNISVSDPGSVATVHYPLFGTNAGALPTTLSPNARSNLTFVPSTGILSTTELRATASTASSTVGSGALVVTGGAGIGGQLTCLSLVETSSIVFKENIEPIHNALDTVMKLFGVTYDRKDNQEHEAGLIAEDVYRHAPDLVSLDDAGKPYGIKYTKLTAYLVESIKTLQQEISSLKNK